MAGEEAAPVVAPDPKDKRFADPEWSQNQFFDFLKQVYLLSVQWAERHGERRRSVDEHTRQKAAFYVKQIANAISPSNFVLTNPELLRETLVVESAKIWCAACTCSPRTSRPGMAISRSANPTPSMFEVGRNLALTPGKVIFQNDLIQLHPIRGDHARSAEGSAADRAALDQQVLHPRSHAGKILHQVVRRSAGSPCSWCRGSIRTRKLAEKSFEQYMREGVMAALDAVEEATGEKQVHAIGYCVGGTLLAITLAYLAAKQDNRVLSATMFAAQVDFTYAGDLMVFVDKERIAQLEAHMKRAGLSRSLDAWPPPSTCCAPTT